MKIRIATRKSALALAQTRWVAAQLKRLDSNVVVEEVHIQTQGDLIFDKPLAKIGGKGLFINEVENALATEQADLAVHSMKDVPAKLHSGLCIIAVPKRELPHDVIVSRHGSLKSVFDLDPGMKLASSSLRRVLQLHQHRNDLGYVTIRGNVDTRLAKLNAGSFDAIVLAYAGLARLGLWEQVQHQALILPEQVCLPAIGQGALALEAPMESPFFSLFTELNDPDTRACIDAERAFGAALEANCSTPLACHASFAGGCFRVEGNIAALDGRKIVRSSVQASLSSKHSPVELGRELAEHLLNHGGRELLGEALNSSDPYRHGIFLQQVFN